MFSFHDDIHLLNDILGGLGLFSYLFLLRASSWWVGRLDIRRRVVGNEFDLEHQSGTRGDSSWGTAVSIS